MWPPLIWAKHCTMVAILNPKQSEMSTRSAGGGLSLSDAQLIVEPRLISTKISVAKNSPETARQNTFVQMPLKAAIMLSHLHSCRNLQGEKKSSQHSVHMPMSGLSMQLLSGGNQRRSWGLILITPFQLISSWLVKVNWNQNILKRALNRSASTWVVLPFAHINNAVCSILHWYTVF